mmetsp:Transcript_8703/g.25067  ORF Transcript_8703/g.25067 Transcript_8703/m.25067 type:complete len:202 (-) Transcript_8703:910-1515(-)
MPMVRSQKLSETSHSALGFVAELTFYPFLGLGLQERRCQLTPRPKCRRFKSQAINLFLASLFQQISQHATLPPFELTRWDLFHGHLFIDYANNQMGLLFHAQEYPAYSEEFPIVLGFCQEGSTLAYDEEKMRVRNILWWNDALHVLDTGKGSVLNDLLLQEGLRDFVYTVDEADFGERVLDVSYFNTPAAIQTPSEGLFVC